MLTHIYIRDLATIDELSLSLNRGCTMITGETGAGKSVFIEAIELALGGRASTNLIRDGKTKAEISLSFDIKAFIKVIDRLKKLDLYQEGDQCIIRRIITQDGRTRCYINGSPVNVQLLRELGELLFHLHSQHDQQILLRSETQREMLDRYADASDLALQIKILAEEWKRLDHEIVVLRMQTAERASKCEFLRFQLAELDEVAIESDEWIQLEADHHRLTHQEDLIVQIEQIKKLLQDDDKSILSLLYQLSKTLDIIHTYTPQAKSWSDNIDQVIIQLKDLYSEVKHALDRVELDPQILQTIERKVTQIFSIARKYKVSPSELIQLKKQLAADLERQLNTEENLTVLLDQQKHIEKTYQSEASRLSQIREKAAIKLANEINSVIRSLSLPHGEFKVNFTPEQNKFALHGREKINFLIKTNPGQALLPLDKVISGGELSRFSLAMHLALAHHTTIPILIFDEVDTGVSGGTAEKIGKLLRKLGNAYQVFCITHQAQVAAYGEYHLLVEKTFTTKIARTHLKLLDKQDKAKEIARMLGGEHITAKTLAHAREVIENV